MVRFIWSLSIIWFLKLRGYPALGADRAVKFTIYNLGSIQLFQQAIQSRSYMNSSLSELEVGFDLSCDPPKRMRLQKRNGFPNKPESASRASSERINVSA